MLLLAFAFSWDVLIALLAIEASSLFEKLLAFHGDLWISDVFLFNNVTHNCNSLCSNEVVSRHHADSNACSVHVGHCLWHFSTDDVHDADNRNQGESTSLDVFHSMFLRRFVVPLTVLILVQILIG